MIPKTIIEKILDAAHIEDVVGEFLPLQKRGTIYRALCPFHQEKTPSFTVTPNRSMFYCFGCHKGGNVITFLMEHENMTYPEAVRWLGRKYGIEVEEREETIDEKQQRLKRESLLIVNTAVHKHYREVFLRYKPAQDYAYRRWGQKYCDEIEIGFAPIDGKALAHLPLQKEFLQELGLINPQGYDFFQNRIVIPIKDRYQHIIGFTARVMDDSQPKYLNSKESLLYSKRSTVFGLDVAWRAAGKTGQMYLVEGAPDCMRLHAIGVQNAVADLGSAWTVEQFQLIKRAANKVCFIPDNDPLKGGADYGTGIEAVMKAGKLATEQHLTVSVKEITTTEEGKKEDPDTYFKNQTLFKAVEEEDFILWLAAKLFETSGNTEQKSDAVKRIAHLLSFIDDDTKLTMFIDALTKYHRGKLFWQKAIENERTRRDSPKEDDIDLNRQYGFWIDRGKYFSTTEKGGVLEWSNFTLTPLFHIKDPLMAKRLYLLTNELGVKEIVEMEQEDLISLQKFRQKLESLGNFIWKASEKELIKLKSFLYEKTETAAQIKQLGWNKKGFFAFGNGIFDGRQFHEVNEYGIVHLGEKGNFYLPALSRIYKENTDYFRFERQFVHFNFSMISLRDFTRQLFLVFGDNGKIGLLLLSRHALPRHHHPHHTFLPHPRPLRSEGFRQERTGPHAHVVLRDRQHTAQHTELHHSRPQRHRGCRCQCPGAYRRIQERHRHRQDRVYQGALGRHGSHAHEHGHRQEEGNHRRGCGRDYLRAGDAHGRHRPLQPTHLPLVSQIELHGKREGELSAIAANPLQGTEPSHPPAACPPRQVRPVLLRPVPADA